jgi:trimethylamine--corrinoid protein Co-methyltransferase
MNKIEKIYQHALNILSEVGIKLKHLEVLNILDENGIQIDEETAFFTPEQVAYWISKAPESFTLYARNPAYNIVIGNQHRHFMAGYGCAAIYDKEGTARDSLLSDYICFARLVHQCGHFSINGGILAQPNDVPAEISHLIMTYAAMTTSDKCLMGIPGNEDQVTQIMEMAALLFGGRSVLEKTPRILTMVSTISPLLIDEMDLSTILVSARYNQPMIISPASTAGTTGPIDLAGNLALSTAEALAAIVIAQIIRPGVPVVFGLQSNVANLRTGNISVGSPAYSLQKKAVCELARYLKLPSRSGGATTDSAVISPQAGYESMLSLMAAYQNGVNLIVHSAGILNSYAAMSYEKFMMDLELMDMIMQYEAGFEVNDDTLNLELIKSVGPGGHFLGAADTMKKCRSHSRQPRIGVRENFGRRPPLEKYFENIEKGLEQMLREYKQPDMPPDILRHLNDFMTGQGIPAPVLEQLNHLTCNLEDL